jgi:hypothetical protein
MSNPARPGGRNTFRAEPTRRTPTEPLAHARRASVAALVAALLLALPAARGSVVVPKEFADLAAEADLVFVGTVARIESRWADPGKNGIETLVTFSDIEPIKGPVGREETLRFGGGEIDGLREEIAGVPRFAPRERVVLFVRQERSVSPVIGFSQGCFRVVEDEQGRAVRGCDGHPVVLPAAHAPLRAGTTADAAAERVGLEEFLDRVRREIERQPGDAR